MFELSSNYQKDGSGGCDGCLSWKNMGYRPICGGKSLNDCPATPLAEKTDNNDMSRTVFWLEVIYNRVDWPFTIDLGMANQSLKDSGKSRADLWAFASWVALERAVERANHACDHDNLNRQQIPILEGREKCDIKLNRKVSKLVFRQINCSRKMDDSK